MSMILNEGKKLLRQIVGAQGYTNSYPRYLALSSTKPNNDGSGVDPTNPYNITEPSGASYKRVNLTPNNGNFYFNADPTGEIVGDDYVITISNTAEIHFDETTESWGTVKYFVIFSNNDPVSTTNTPIYFGKLVYEGDEGITIDSGTVPLIKVGQLEISVK